MGEGAIFGAMSAPPLIARLVRISGRVQGVGFRAWAEQEATARDLHGWVRNRRDGTVEALFVGDEASVADMIGACWQGPRLAVVSDVATTPVEPVPTATRFRQQPTM